jgi:hypothetical protein
MEQFFIYQVRINLIQQSLVNFDTDTSDTKAFQNIAKDIVQIAHDVLGTDNNLLIDEYMPQIENLCDILNTKHQFINTNPIDNETTIN